MKKIFLFISLIGLIITSCENKFSDCLNDVDNPGQYGVVLTPEELKSIAYDNPKELSEAEIFKIAENFIISYPHKSKTRNISNVSFNIKSKKYINKSNASTLKTRSDGNESIPVYELYVNEGQNTSYMMISADERIASVMAYFPEAKGGEEFETGLNDPNTIAIFAMCKAQLIEDINEVELIRNTFREKTIKKVCEKLNVPENEYSYEKIKEQIGVKTEGKTRVEGVQEINNVQVIESCQPLVYAEWDQNRPYNNKCPQRKVDMGIGNPKLSPVPAGCGVIALAHMEAALKRPVVGGVNVKWDYLLEFRDIREDPIGNDGDKPDKIEMAAKMIRGIFDEVDARPLENSAGNVTSTAVYPSDLTTYINKYTYNSSSQSFNADVVLNSLRDKRIVFLWGDTDYKEYNSNNYKTAGHAFVIDGYMVTNKRRPRTSTRSLVQIYDVYWHANLGWGYNSSAYFKLSTDASCILEFTGGSKNRTYKVDLSKQTIVANIRRK